MSARLIDGKASAERLRDRVKHSAAGLAARHGRTPGLAVVLVGDDPASRVYVAGKVKQTREAGMLSVEHRLPADTPEGDVIALVERLNADPAVDGILAQLPLPPQVDPDRIIARLDPLKDVDGLTSINAGRLASGRPGLRPCTPEGCVILARETLGELRGLQVVVVGRSVLVGRPAALLFLAEDCTVTVAHSRTRDLPEVCRGADVLVAAVGRPELVRGDWIKPGACVLDVGINRVPAPEKGEGGTRLVGDVAFDEAIDVAGAITPVPGGVGPMTIACLLRNTVLAACAREGWPEPEGL
ncbi:MAG TPA: bifunctional methylenetetrahydrofolate dehydrogenase/methenyltetrahydrofolate cyclohydrolase FolD [Caulobacteraceae bacterium]